MQYKATNKTVEQVGRELGVEYVLEGSVWRAGEQVRINAQLIQVSDQAQLWADSYEGDLGNVFTLQGQVARAVAREVGVTLSPQMEVALARPAQVNRKAHEAYLKGRYLQSKLTEEAARRALEYFQEAVREDPGYALAYVGLAGCYTGLAEYNWLRAEEAYPKAVAAAEKALEIDGNLSEAYSMLASISFIHDWDWLDAEEKFRRAIALNPNNANVRVGYAIYLTSQGRHSEALAEMQHAQELDPISLHVGMNVGVRLYYARQYNLAIKELQKTLELYPDSNLLLHNLGHVYLQAGKYEEAIATLQKAETLYGRNAHNQALLAEVYAAAGRKQDAQRLLDELLRLAKQGKAHSRDVAGIYVALGEKEQAFAWLEKAYEARDPYLRYVRVDPRLDPLRSDPRFQELLRRMNL